MSVLPKSRLTVVVLLGFAPVDWLVVGVIRVVRRGRRRVQLVAVR